MTASKLKFMSPVVEPTATPAEVEVPDHARGRRLGFLSNRKPNAAEVEREVARLADEAGLIDSITFYEKPSPGEGAPAELLDQIGDECDAIMVGSADCGSCTAWCCNDAAALESRGLRAILLCTSAFVPLATAQTKALGYPGIGRFEVPHPLGGSTEDVAIDKAKTAWPQMEEWLSRVVPAASTVA